MSDPTPTPSPGRTLSQWLLLFGVWAVGLVVWTIYLVVLGYVLLVIL